MFWLIVAPLTQLAQAEAPDREIPEVTLPEVPYFKEYALKQVVEIWSVDEWESFDKIIQHESEWDNTARNPKSTALGYGQTLIGTEKEYDCVVRSLNPNEQIDCVIKYIKQRYGSPSKALRFWDINKWY